ncbi:MAG TPA: zf-HC2 domain-containing protein [Natronosporangium sp.]|nr:zf-HC2 domain-containing protein [Natronosporangium sp.]
MTCPFAHTDGAYVLGALPPAERSAYESHLAECASCAAAVARLAPVPGLLGRADPVALRREAPSPPRLPRLLQAMTAERQRQRRTRRLRLAAAVAVTAVLAVVGTATALGLITGDPQPPQAQSTRAEVSPTEAMWPVEADVPVIARVGITPTDAGTEVLLYCAYTSPPPEPTAPPTPPPDPSADPWADPSAPHAFWLVAVGADGSTEPMGSWLAGPGDELTMTGITRYTGDELARLELHGYGKVLLVLDLPG